ncbi:MAG: rRNA pseudouridine synthase [Spirochaetales bacterium]|nr:rRNA pseudouridine synthase [Spirochaetales bacterium]
MTNEKIRLQVYMAHAGVASRRKCEELITLGKVQVNGKTVTEPGFKVSRDDEIIYEGKRLFPVKNYVYIALNKPVKYISSMYDPEGRAVAADLIKSDYSGRLYNVGRLDYMSSGLLLFTNDGDFARKVSHPSSGIDKEYLVETKEIINEEKMLAMKKGIRMGRDVYRIKSFALSGNRRVKVVLLEGKNREIRKMFSNLSYTVKKLQRIRIGPVELHGLAPGQYRFLGDKEIRILKEG